MDRNLNIFKHIIQFMMETRAKKYLKMSTDLYFGIFKDTFHCLLNRSERREALRFLNNKHLTLFQIIRISEPFN